jgi:hypothetical protein
MTCAPMNLGNGVAIVCSRGRQRAPKCSVRGCRNASRYQCDYPIAEGETCDRHLCAEHRVPQGRDLDFCPEHDPGELFRGARLNPAREAVPNRRGAPRRAAARLYRP